MTPAIRVDRSVGSSLALLVLAITLAFAARGASAQPAPGGGAASILNSKHNLSASGPGSIRAASEAEVCVFCHTPHNSSPVQPAWNRNVPVSAYTVYRSSSLDALPGQPTGSSKLCLSCHDGTIAVGNVLSREQEIAMAGGAGAIPPGNRSNLGTDLSDDHPISFRYDQTLAGRDPKLKSPTLLPEAVRLDARGEMQCTTCHEPHNNSYGKFLVMDNANARLCTSCHAVGATSVEGHASCDSCHAPHAAPSGPLLLKGDRVRSTCVSCLASQSRPRQGPNVASELMKLSMHDTDPPVEPRDHAPSEVACNDCHEPHTMQTGGLPGAPGISPKLGRVSGVNSAGANVVVAQFQYEVCFKCHGDNNAQQPTITRQIVQTSTRLQFAPSAVSFHPVQAAGRNTFVPSLRPGLSTASLIYCTDCHNADGAAGPALIGGGTIDPGGPGAANGPHGSNFAPLLSRQYETLDGTSESPTAYALCYTCHERNSILGNQSFSSHGKHIVDERTPCSVCHDAHGISSVQGTPQRNAKLMNFDTSVVSPDAVTGRLEYRSLGPGAGECYLTCHNVPHSPLGYPGGGPAPVVDPAPNPVEPGLPPPTVLKSRGGRAKDTPAGPVRPGQRLPPPPRDRSGRP